MPLLLHLPRVDRALVGSELLRVAGAAGRRDPSRMHHAVGFHGREDAAVRGGGSADARIAAVALLAAHTGASVRRRMPLFEAVAERDRQPLGLVARDAMVAFESGRNAIRTRQDTEQCA